MYQRCPKCAYKRKSTDISDRGVCPACGLVFSKWVQQRYANPGKNSQSQNQHINQSGDNRGTGFHDILLRGLQHLWLSATYVEPQSGSARFYTYAVIYLFLFAWGWMFISANHYNAELNQSFLHGVNLLFHEAGHVIFSMFGRFLTVLGGSLLQLLMPAIVMAVLLFKNRDSFAASAALWWFAQSMMDLVSYIDDAQRQQMMLLGGVRGKDMPGIHDWNNILGSLGLLEYTHVLAVMISWMAILLMLLAFYWGGYILWKTHSNIK